MCLTEIRNICENAWNIYEDARNIYENAKNICENARRTWCQLGHLRRLPRWISSFRSPLRTLPTTWIWNWVTHRRQTCFFVGTLSKSAHHRYWTKSKVWWWIRLLFDCLLIPRVLHCNIFLDSILHRVLQLLEVHLNTYTSNNLGQSNRWLGHKGASPDFLFVFNYCRWSNPADKDKTLHLELALILASLLVKLDDRVLLQVLV